jgi:hypothetical protein
MEKAHLVDYMVRKGSILNSDKLSPTLIFVLVIGLCITDENKNKIFFHFVSSHNYY